jgi:hypothetical protein
MRVRDLVHGYVHLTALENEIVDHPLVQRLRHVRQNDVAFFVYPCINISRFEHSLGVCHVAGKMASNLQASNQWTAYSAAAGISGEDFVQLCRLYALLHDVGHLPLSHLFEEAFDDYVRTRRPEPTLEGAVTAWFGGRGFTKPHEACGSMILNTILSEVSVPDKYRDKLVTLMTHKRLNDADPLRPAKLLIDSEIDADRADSAARDGRLSGGEYGNFNFDRLCSSVFVRRMNDAWGLAYSHKALSSIESLLADRCHTHMWVHFHHRVVSSKAAASLLIGNLLEREVIKKEDFTAAQLTTRDDVWLWNLLRTQDWKDEFRLCADVLCHRKKGAVKVLWKHRAEYQSLQELLLRAAGLRNGAALLNSLTADYERELSKALARPIREAGGDVLSAA